jgi:hypothetical protein
MRDGMVHHWLREIHPVKSPAKLQRSSRDDLAASTSHEDLLDGPGPERGGLDADRKLVACIVACQRYGFEPRTRGRVPDRTFEQCRMS